MSDRVAIEILDEARPDIPALGDPEVIREALRLTLRLRDEPYLGEKLREKSNVRPLAQADCRKLKFDRADRDPAARPRHRYRLVYRIEPHEGSPATVIVMAVGLKPSVYGQATVRAAKRLRREARERARRRRG